MISSSVRLETTTEQIKIDGLIVCDIVSVQHVAKYLGILRDSQMVMIIQIANFCKTTMLYIQSVM